MLHLACPHCHVPEQIEPERAGEVVRCSHCQKPFRVLDGPVRPQWEYYVEDISDSRSDWLALLNDPEKEDDLRQNTLNYRLAVLGHDGWELVAASFLSAGDGPFWKMIFKRPKGTAH